MVDRLFSAVQPTGNLHLGNYLGAIKNYVELQKNYDGGLFCIADLHALTVHQNPKELRESILKTVATYIACGIDPQQTQIFQQSAVPQHSELSWILGCNTPLGWMNRMIQFKEKSNSNEKSNLGLYSYPVLMAADILLYKGTCVPVGEDQLQHVNLANDIAQSFNHTYKTEYFPEIIPLLQKDACRIMSLRDGTKKMSKSEESDYSRINLTDDNDTIALKIRKAKSDSFIIGISYDKEYRPECSNLLTIYSGLVDTSPEAAAENLKGNDFSSFKSFVADAIIHKITPIREEINKLMTDKELLTFILKRGNKEAREIAKNNIIEIKELVGLI